VADKEGDAPVPLPIDGLLDLHAFAARDAAAVVADYLDACGERGVREVRIVHGKGTGSLRRTVHALLARRHDVEWFRSADETGGGWGATLVRLRAACR
jgi:DNA-nicking Smr family endonuclease